MPYQEFLGTAFLHLGKQLYLFLFLILCLFHAIKKEANDKARKINGLPSLRIIILAVTIKQVIPTDIHSISKAR